MGWAEGGTRVLRAIDRGTLSQLPLRESAFAPWAWISVMQSARNSYLGVIKRDA